MGNAMPARLWNSFNLLAVILFAITVAGLVSGGKMVFDPGRAQTGKEWLIYLFAACLMVINGFLPTHHPDPPVTATTGTPPTAKDGEKSDANGAA
jgi:hypothetical protein